ncbi:pentapeptide repeat-containing protein [Thermostaphylospora chromogena]|uniref:Pentapeptide repeat-containing protein n=1 Tax=Thermostaphylospora chromogena TaxID=35622 RepID=A0A1H1F307_9ACTN|nr:pentapeptide repeat-containing protein [Thermostaphylospora chromogena]SDQ94796.1 Pentapeptide repeat-containing protein [Thermostaphylospora chromogena]
MPTPRRRADLPFAGYLEAFEGEPVPSGVYDTLSVDGREFDGVDAGGARFVECAFSSVTFTAAKLPRARLNDVWLDTVRWTGCDLTETSWLDVEMVGSVLGGVAMPAAELLRVTFHGCKFEGVNLRFAALREVTFADCVLREVDLAEAALHTVAFPGSSLEGVRLHRARMEGVDLRGATALGISDGHDALRGATISTSQLLELAPMLAHALGVTVRDR